MNLEEFDNKLAEAFRNENLPPKDKLWVNIANNIDKPSKSPIWWWVVPSIIIIAVVATFNSIDNTSDAIVSNNKNEVVNPNLNTQLNKNLKQQSVNSPQETLTNNVAKSTEEKNSTTNRVIAPKNKVASSNKNSKQLNNKHQKNQVSNSVANNQNYINTSSNDLNNPTLTSSVNDDDLLKFYGMPYRKLNTKPFSIDEFSLVDVPSIKDIKRKPINKAFFNDKNKVVDFNKKWWFTYGIGPNLSINKLDIDDTKEKFVHKDLWEDKETLTRNGSGFNAFTHLSYHIKPLLSFESGLSYVMRVEPIRLSDESLDIPVRDINTNEITGYNKIIIYLLEKNQTTGLYDTIGSYQLASAHNLAVNNRYNAFTVPLTINKEFVLSSNTKIKLGAGTGITYLYSNKATYLDYITTSKVEFKKKSMINLSFNANLGFYTNFNNVGEIGIYTGYNYYSMPWELPNKQYGLKMSDLNFGFSFRRPLNWGN